MLEGIKKTLEENKNQIIQILKEIEIEEVAEEEYRLCIQALNNNNKYRNQKVDIISSYLPMNLPLYSLVIYVIIPKLSSSLINYRPSTKTLEQSKKIHNLLNLDQYNINLFENTRYNYLKSKVKKSNVVIFVGKPENALNLSNELDDKTMFIYFGVGQNPVIIANHANIELASKKIVETIMFNYGQDCAKPNIILCQKKIYEEFRIKLLEEIEKNINKKTTIKNLQTLKEVSELLIHDNDYIEYGGNIDFKNKTLNPIVIAKPFVDEINNYNEYYAPIFRIMIYENITDLKKYFSCNKYKSENMNISLFGESKYVDNLPSSLILHNEMIPEIDNGYCEYGGYGEKTSYLLYRGIKIVKPILINREIDYFYNNTSFVSSAKEVSGLKNMNSKLKIILFNEYKSYIKNLFTDNLSFSFVFGSYAKRKQKLTSDIDMLVCLQKENKELTEKFREWYFKFHYLYGKTPDFYYPGEIVTEERLNNIIANNKNIMFNIKNDNEVFDSIFYTQIMTDKKIELVGDKSLILKYESEFKKFVPDFCNQIFELLNKENLIRDERDYMKCLIALSCDDLLFFGKRLEFETPEDKYDKLVNKIDDGFFVKCLKRKQQL